jgi:tRNA-specific 2-thiouridylase
MSGGVDSSVTAYLLRELGYDVVGMTMKIWPGDGQATGAQRSCCGTDAVADARRVAQILEIPYYVIDMVGDFEREVIGNFVSEYMAGRTPHPCIRCNTQMKFGRLLAKACEVGAAKVATGHYARLRQDRRTGRWQVLRAAFAAKDQSYALWGLTQDQLARALFPLGEMDDKARVREIARTLALPVSDKPDSQEICFVSTGNYREFLAGRTPGPGAGDFVDARGAVLGRHAGHTHFTVGQRRGLGIARGERTYVVAIQPDANRVVLGGERDLSRAEFSVAPVNWLSIPRPDGPIACSVKIRYNGPPAPAEVVAAAPAAAPGGTASPAATDRAVVRAATGFRAVTPGQSAVFYDAEGMLLGGGLIAA